MPNEPFDDDISMPPELAALLADESLWEPLDPAVENAIAATISAEAVSVAPVVSITSGLRWRNRLVIGAAAAALFLAGIAFVNCGDADPTSIEVALEATELAPDASGAVTIDDTPLGTRLILDVAGLPPAAPGHYYEAWMRTGPEAGVSAGTFHLRGGDGEIELWAGVTLDAYPLFTITIQDEADPLSSGRVVLKGRVAE